jgi:matrixin
LNLQAVGLLAGLTCCTITAAAAAEVTHFRLLNLAGNNVHWHNPAPGQAPVVSYAIAKETREFPGARNCGKLTSLNGLAAASQLSEQVIRREIASAFAVWQAAANIAFREIETPNTADILIGAQVEPEGWAFTNVFYDVRSADAIKPISKSLICLNPLKQWKVGFDGNLTVYDLRYTLTHEIGHAIGLDHPDGSAEIMDYRYEEMFRELQPGDVAGAVLLYGPHPEMVADTKADDPIPRPSPPRLSAEHSGARALPAPSHN